MYLTKAPKLAEAMPTPNAKTIENSKQKTKKLSFLKIFMKVKGFTDRRMKNVKDKDIKFSIPDIIMVGLPDSHKNGL